ncbi:hypothetical protein I5M19_06110 [Mucilaginibacter sp. SD-g]|uniref:Type VI secretion system (T6SS), amidase effector protein 4 n=1 Tax=Mucilaginibacter segetis TaxID=2793071 RepID=A0A934PSL9_9SPHI|nr:hypothetical protein [Mucilaginibacter segetis]
MGKSGVNLKGAKHITNPGHSAYSNGNIVGTTNLAWFLRNNYLGKPEIYNGTKDDVLQNVLGRQGIIYFQGIVEGGVRSNANGHMELWDRTHYMSNFSHEQMFGRTTIWFWPLKQK